MKVTRTPIAKVLLAIGAITSIALPLLVAADCDEAINNRGEFFGWTTGTGTCPPETICELDLCRCYIDEGWIEYCIHPQYAGMYPGCLQCGT
jgi:hypothetical protein